MAVLAMAIKDLPPPIKTPDSGAGSWSQLLDWLVMVWKFVRTPALVLSPSGDAPTAPTGVLGDSSTQIATNAFVQQALGTGSSLSAMYGMSGVEGSLLTIPTPIVALNFPGRLTAISYFTTSGTYVKATNNPSFIIVEVWGGGGGSGGIAGAANQCSGGGGAGGYSRQMIVNASLLSTETVTIGGGGSAGSTTPTSGGTGGTSSFGSHCSATGGLGSDFILSGTSASGAGGAGGTGVGGDLNLKGSSGLPGVASGSGVNYMVGGTGGSSTLGGNGVARNAISSNGNAALANSASGGSGGISNTPAQAGAAGGSGFIIVYEYT